MPIINAFNDIAEKPLPETEGVGGFDDLRSVAALQVGIGSRAFKADQDGIFLGGNTFASAPFSVDMQGNLIAASATFSQYVTTIVGDGYGKNFVSTLVWTATDYNTASWGSGTIKTSDGVSYSISAGNTGNIAALTYVYLDPDTSITVLQKTTVVATAMGNGKILIAIVQIGASGSKCIIDAVGSRGTTIDGDRITTGKIQSSDGKTYFDLDGDVIIINDGSNDRALFGYQLGGF